MLPRRVATFALAALFPASSWAAQVPSPADSGAPAPAQYDAPAYIAVVDGSATLERDGRIEVSPLNMPLMSGDKLRTTGGRVEVRFADGGRLMVDSNSAVDVLADDLVRLVDGRVRLTLVRGSSAQLMYRVDSPAGSVRIFQPGDYRVALLHGAATSPGVAGDETQLEFAVISGGGEIATDQGTTAVRAGERAYASAGLLPSYAYPYNSAAGDDFDRWVESQRDTVYASTSLSAQYLPADMTSYASTFDQYGDWRYQQTYGYVWYPRVAADWRPYYYGSWASYPTYGWTWVAADPFGYPTHHYGRWGVSAGLWFWIPSAYWGPAYVSWAYAPNYVSWCPLGWDNHAVFSIGFYNAGPAYYSSHYHGRYYAAWTTVPHRSFGHGSAHAYAVAWDRSYAGTRPQFTEGHAPSDGRYAGTRAATAVPIRSAGTRNLVATRPVPGGGASDRGQPAADGGVNRGIGQSPRYINRGNEIVRSQTARPIAPRDTSPPTTRPGRTQVVPGPVQGRVGPAQAAPSPYAQRPPRAGDNLSYRPPGHNPSSTAPSYNAPSYSRPSSTAPSYSAPSYSRPSYTAPSYNAPSYNAPQGRGYERAIPRQEAPAMQPRGYEPTSPRQGGNQPRPEYARPGGGGGYAARPSAPSGGGERAAPRSSGGGHVETRAPSGAGVPHRGRR